MIRSIRYRQVTAYAASLVRWGVEWPRWYADHRLGLWIPVWWNRLCSLTANWEWRQGVNACRAIAWKRDGHCCWRCGRPARHPFSGAPDEQLWVYWRDPSVPYLRSDPRQGLDCDPARLVLLCRDCSAQVRRRDYAVQKAEWEHLVREMM